MGLFRKRTNRSAVRVVDLSQPLRALANLHEYPSCKVVVTWESRILGSFEIENKYMDISLSRLQMDIAENLPLHVLEPDQDLEFDFLWSEAATKIAEGLSTAQANQEGEKEAANLIDLSLPLRPLIGVQDFAKVDVMVTWKGQPLGTLPIQNNFQSIGISRLKDAIAEGLGLKILRTEHELGQDALMAEAQRLVAKHYFPGINIDTKDEQLPVNIKVSIVIATLDRPDDLRDCLKSLSAQISSRPIEIIVVDNHPASGLTPPVVAEFPGVILAVEKRKGLAYARNAGISASTGEIIIATDDDVIVPPNWVEKLVAPFARRNVMIVNGNVLPAEMETPAQVYFEMYGGLGRGFERIEVNGDWFDSYRFKTVPTWKLGATANSAFRASIFSHPAIGLMDEMLGPGMPSGVGEDTFVFYKVLKAGYTIVYEPEAYVWHKHRRTMESLRKQLFNYSKGGVAFHFALFFKEGDIRGLTRIFVELPGSYLWRLYQRLNGKSHFPLSLLILEMYGNLWGFLGLLRSYLRVKQEGRSKPYIPVSQRFSSNTITQTLEKSS